MPRNARQLALFTSFLCLSLIFAPTASSQQRIYTVAGGYVGDGGPATAASLAFPQYAIFDAHDNRLISDGQNCRIRSVDKNGNISTIAGTGICGFSGDGRKAVRLKSISPQGWGWMQPEISSSLTRGIHAYEKLTARAGSRPSPVTARSSIAGTEGSR